MKFLTNDKYAAELEKIKRENRQKLLKRSLRAEKSKYKKKIHIETSKLIAIYLFILLNAIVETNANMLGWYYCNRIFGGHND